MATDFRILAWEMSQTEGPVGYRFTGSKSQTTTIDPSIYPHTPSIYLSGSPIENCIKETKGN